VKMEIKSKFLEGEEGDKGKRGKCGKDDQKILHDELLVVVMSKWMGVDDTQFFNED